MRLTQIFAAAAIALVSTFAVADDAADKAIRKSLENLELEVPVESITASPLPGLYEVKLKGSRVLYASADGQYIVQGYLFQLKDGKPVNLTEKTERLGISKLINAIPVAETVVYPAIGETKSHITVFTDTTCPYCHKLHAEVPELNKRGIEVRTWRSRARASARRVTSSCRRCGARKTRKRPWTRWSTARKSRPPSAPTRFPNSSPWASRSA
jgi:thiol:disulfide interchange protein DsbC